MNGAWTHLVTSMGGNGGEGSSNNPNGNANPFTSNPMNGNAHGSSFYHMYNNDEFADSTFGGTQTENPTTQTETNSGLERENERNTREEGEREEEGEEEEEEEAGGGGGEEANDVPEYPYVGDPPSGGRLIHNIELTTTDPVIIDAHYQDVPIFPESSQGKKHKPPSTEIPRYADRLLIHPDDELHKFVEEVANGEIGRIWRRHYRGSLDWPDVSTGLRDLLWREFGLRFRWDCNWQRIYAIWEKQCILKHREMQDEIKKKYDKGKRPTWLQPRHFRYQHVHRFMDAKRKAFSAKMSKIRGKKATHFAGQKSLVGLQRNMNKRTGREGGLTVPCPAVYIISKQPGVLKNLDKLVTTVNDSQAEVEDGVLPTAPSLQRFIVKGNFYNFTQHPIIYNPRSSNRHSTTHRLSSQPVVISVPTIPIAKILIIRRDSRMSTKYNDL